MIRVCDAIMGSGKSSAAITYMNEHCTDKFIYITPYLDEAARIKANCPLLHFVEPSKGIAEYGFSKTGHTLALLAEGRNIATTHQAFLYYTQETLDLISQKGYKLIIDENVNVLEKCAFPLGDLQTCVRAGYIAEHADGRYELVDDSYSGTAFTHVFRMLRSRELLRDPDDDEHVHYWALPPALIKSFSDVFILTYLFDGQDIHHFLEMYQIAYKRIGVRKGSDGVFRFDDDNFYIPDYVGELGKHIHIYDNPKMNAIGDGFYDLSMNWFSRSDNVTRLKSNVYNYFRNIMGDDTSALRMWGTYDNAQTQLRGRGYSNKFVIFNEKATNKYRDRNVLVYAVNLFMNAGQKRFYQKRGVNVSDDIYALSSMVQWIWRSAIRDGGEVYIYIPSSRMRGLLIKWIAEVEDQHRQYIANTTRKEAC